MYLIVYDDGHVIYVVKVQRLKLLIRNYILAKFSENKVATSGKIDNPIRGISHDQG